MEIFELSKNQEIKDMDNTICTVTDFTSNSVEVFIKKKTSTGIDCKQWFTVQDFNKRFKNMNI